MNRPPIEVTQLLIAWGKGDQEALDQLAPLVESELLKCARRYLRNEGPGHTLQPTALVNEACMRLIEWQSVEWQNRAHFFAVAAKLMRRILVNHARSRGRQKRGGGLTVMLTEAISLATERSTNLVALDDALIKLATFDETKSRLVELRFFGGLTEEEAAEVLKCSIRTVQREWNLARSWLFRELSTDPRA